MDKAPPLQHLAAPCMAQQASELTGGDTYPPGPLSKVKTFYVSTSQSELSFN